MTVESSLSRISYAGNGATLSFSYPYYFQNQADLVVKLYNTVTGAVTDQVLTTNYSITGTVTLPFGYESGGSIVMLVAPPTGTNIVIYRDPSAVQSLEIPAVGPLPTKDIEAELDYQTMLLQRAKEILVRSVHLNDGMTGTFDTALPSTLALNPSTAVVVNSDGTGFDIGPTTTAISAAATNAAAAATSAAQAAASAAQALLTANYFAGTSGGSANAQTLTPTVPLVSYVAGIRYTFIAGFTNTTAATMNISGLGVKSLKEQSGDALTSGEITAGRTYNIVYDGTNFIVGELSTPEDGSVTTAKIVDANVTRAKLAVGGVGLDSVTASQTTTYPVTTSDDFIPCNAASAFTVTLPTAVGVSGRKYAIKRTDQTLANALTIATTSSQTIDGVTTRKLMTQYEMLRVVSDGANWHILDRHISALWTSYTPTLSAGFGTTSNVAFKWRRDKNDLLIIGTWTMGTGAASLATITLPTGLAIDTTVFQASNIAGDLIQSSTNAGDAYVISQPGTSTTLLYLSQSNAGAAGLTAVNGSTFANGSNFATQIRVPIANWEG